MQKYLYAVYCLVFGLSFIAGGRAALKQRDDESKRPRVFSHRDFTIAGWICISLGVFALIAAVITLILGPVE
jgi:hypothetical protein